MGTWLRIVAWAVAFVGAAYVLLDYLFFEAWRVPTDDPLTAASIEPTLSAGDLVVVTRHGSPARGELLRCADPEAPGRFVIARAIAYFGDHVSIKGEFVDIDGRRTPSGRACDAVTLHDPRSGDDVELACSVEEFAQMEFGALRSSQHPEPPTNATVDASRWYLVSDNRHIHLDSRDFGQVDPASCQHIVFRLASAAGFGDAKKRLNIIW